jgi:hypothetical protein
LVVSVALAGPSTWSSNSGLPFNQLSYVSRDKRQSASRSSLSP